MPPLTRKVSPGHGVSIAFAIPDPITGAAGAYVLIGNINNDVKKPALKRETKETTGHDDGRTMRIPSSVLDVGELSVSVNTEIGSPAQDAETGIQFLILTNQIVFIRLWGPGGEEDTDEWIFLAYFTNCQETLPVKVGQRTYDITITPAGDTLTIDGVDQ